MKLTPVLAVNKGILAKLTKQIIVGRWKQLTQNSTHEKCKQKNIIECITCTHTINIYTYNGLFPPTPKCSCNRVLMYGSHCSYENFSSHNSMAQWKQKYLWNHHPASDSVVRPKLPSPWPCIVVVLSSTAPGKDSSRLPQLQAWFFQGWRVMFRGCLKKSGFAAC